MLPLNAAVNPLLYTLSTVQFAEQVEKRLHTFRISWKRSFTMKTCTTAVTEGRGRWSEEEGDVGCIGCVCRFGVEQKGYLTGFLEMRHELHAVWC